jgi:hypothetical protein
MSSDALLGMLRIQKVKAAISFGLPTQPFPTLSRGPTADLRPETILLTPHPASVSMTYDRLSQEMSYPLRNLWSPGSGREEGKMDLVAKLRKAHASGRFKKDLLLEAADELEKKDMEIEQLHSALGKTDQRARRYREAGLEAYAPRRRTISAPRKKR